MSAAAPWMGMLRATRCPKLRVLKFDADSSGSRRRRPKIVVTYPFFFASAMVRSIYAAMPR